MKFGRLVQNDMLAAVIWSKWKPEIAFRYGRLFFKPEIEFQYGGRLVFLSRNSYISAVD